MARTIRGIGAATAALALVLGLASCGGEEEPADSGAGPTDLGSATIVLGGKVITWAAAYVAVCENFFDDHGLDVELTVSPQGTTAAIAGLVSGDALSAMTGAPAAVSPIREGAPVQMLFNASLGYGAQVVASAKVIEKKGITPDSSLEDRVHALRGETIGILNPGDSLDQLLRFVLPKFGMDPDKDITMLALSNYANMFAAMKIDKIGGLAGSPPNGNRAESEGLGTILFSGDDFEQIAQYPYLVGSANTREIAENPERIKALVAGIADAMKLLRDDPDAGKPCMRKEFPDLDQKTFDAAYAYTVNAIPDSPLITPEVFKSLSDFADTNGAPLGVDYEKAVAADIVKDAIG